METKSVYPACSAITNRMNMPEAFAFPTLYVLINPTGTEPQRLLWKAKHLYLNGNKTPPGATLLILPQILININK